MTGCDFCDNPTQELTEQRQYYMGYGNLHCSKCKDKAEESFLNYSKKHKWMGMYYFRNNLPKDHPLYNYRQSITVKRTSGDIETNWKLSVADLVYTKRGQIIIPCVNEETNIQKAIRVDELQEQNPNIDFDVVKSMFSNTLELNLGKQTKSANNRKA
tara:strand:+ start:4117 stop:4587 length:471 start_codon:yes stop_codon:yes gene_type:complete